MPDLIRMHTSTPGSSGFVLDNVLCLIRGMNELSGDSVTICFCLSFKKRVYSRDELISNMKP